MNKISIITGLLFAATSLFTACQDDHASNPTLVDPSPIVLNTPPYASELFDLASSSHINLTWSQPTLTDLNAPIAVNGRGIYSIQVSTTGTFATSVAQAAADDTGATIADYAQLDETFGTASAAIEAKSLAKAIMQINKWEEDKVPAQVEAYIRIVANTVGMNPTTAPGTTTYSNVVKLNVVPYYVELRDAPVVLAYLVGGNFANGNWGNKVSDIGIGNVPMFPIEGADYDKKTGIGLISYTDYFPATGEFKILPHRVKNDAFDWEWAYISGGQPGKAVSRNGGEDGGNITVPKAGYYTITVDNAANTCEIKEVELKDVQTYKSMGLVSSLDDWATDLEMKAVNIKAATNHLWMCEFEATRKCEVKFRVDKSWDTSWGKAAFPFGKGQLKSETNIPVTKGKYKVFFNDLTGEYNFILQQ
ncbi:MAG: SusF/SusE family outer membrane protein [Bacteroidaceae bacterium]|nr:SusF/SusE family outer membrane protein [Bacteroidaceae bacterium]